MIVYIRKKPFPRCKYCGKRMDYWIPEQEDEDACHPGCAGKAIANEYLARLREEIRAAQKKEYK